MTASNPASARTETPGVPGTLDALIPTRAIKLAAVLLGVQVCVSALTQVDVAMGHIQRAALVLACVAYLTVTVQGRRGRVQLVLSNALAIAVVLLGHGFAEFAPTVAVGSTCAESPRRYALAAAVMHTAVVAAVTAHFRGWQRVPASSLAVFASAAFVIAFVDVALSEWRARTQLSLANARLAQYALQAEELARTKERNRLARELHDSMGHYLAVTHVQIQVAESQIDGDSALLRASLANAARLIHEGLEDVRHSVSALRASPMEHMPLPDALAGLVAQLRDSSETEARFEVHGDSRVLPPAVELTLYRAMQEGLNNVRKHALAKHVNVTLTYEQTQVELWISDDGRGAADTPSLGFGLLGVRERVQFVHGTLQITRTPGFALKLIIPAVAIKTS
jgi:signal transduction histidine kinase